MLRCTLVKLFNYQRSQLNPVVIHPLNNSNNFVSRLSSSKSNDKNRLDINQGETGHHKSKQQDNEEATSKCSFEDCINYLLSRRLLETFGYVGAAIVVGFNLQYSINYTSKNVLKCGYDNNHLVDHNVKCPFLRRVIAFAYPTNKGLKVNVLPNSSSDEGSSSSSSEDTETICYSESPKDADESNDKGLIEEICHQLKDCSIDYIERLNNLMGVALIDKDPEQAIKCWSSCKRDAKSLFNLGVAYETGKHSVDGQIDLVKAFEHYKIAAALGHNFAIYNLALFYLNGRGVVDVDVNQADNLLRQAATLGVEPAIEYVKFEDKIKKKEMEKKRNETRDTFAHAFNHESVQKKTNFYYKSKSPKKTMKTSSSVPNLHLFNHMNIFESMLMPKKTSEFEKQFKDEDKRNSKFHLKNNFVVNYDENLY